MTEWRFFYYDIEDALPQILAICVRSSESEEIACALEFDREVPFHFKAVIALRLK